MSQKRAATGFKGIALAPVTENTLTSYKTSAAESLPYAGSMSRTAKESTTDLYYDDDLYAQIKNGAPFDVLLAADAKTPAKAVKEGHGVAGTTFTYAVGKLVLWSSDAALVKDQKALLHPTVKKVAVADARLAPYGEAALQALDALKMKEAVEPKFVVSNNIGKTFQFVESGNTQIGFVALSQCFKNGAFTGGSGWVVPQDLYKPILQDAVQLKAGEKNAGAKRFLDYLKTSNEAAAIREAYGYGTVR